MRRVTPEVWLIAHTTLRDNDVRNWLSSIGGEACLDHITGSQPEQLIELAARRCYKSFSAGLNPNVTKVRTVSREYHENILKSRHGSVLEHATATFAIEFVSRVFTHELVRNRAGNAFSQESLRYVRLQDLSFWLPPEIQNSEARRIFEDLIEQMEIAQLDLAAEFDLDNLSFEEKKRLTSAFRRIAPMGLATGIVLTCNFRSLRWLIEQRTDVAAEEEIRMVFDMIAMIALREWPMIFQDFAPVAYSPTPSWKPKYSKV